MGRQSIKVKHNMEMAHRLSLMPGKCEAIHGHSWWTELEIIGRVDSKGVILEFGDVKKKFRQYLDSKYDHHLLLNHTDPIIWNNVTDRDLVPSKVEGMFPGLYPVEDDPTTENVARWIGEWAVEEFSTNFDYVVTVWETSVNCATWRSDAATE